MKKIIIGVICIVLLVSFGLLACFLFQGNDKEIKQLTKQLEQLFEESYYQAGDSSTTEGAIARYIEKNVSWKVIGCENDKCKIEISYPDASTLLRQLMFQTGREATEEKVAETMEELLEQLENGNVEKKKVVVVANVVDGVPKLNEEMLDALSGGLLTVYAEVLDAYMQERLGEMEK